MGTGYTLTTSLKRKHTKEAVPLEQPLFLLQTLEEGSETDTAGEVAGKCIVVMHP